MTPTGFWEAGIAVLPVCPGSKRPAVSWRRYQSRLPVYGEVRRWFLTGRPLNAAVVCGWKGLTVLDFDDTERYRRWLAWAAVRGGVARRVGIETYRVRTARGIHLYLFVDDAPRTGRFEGGDVKGRGGYVLIPPSVHPSGVRYEAVDEAAPIVRVATLADVVAEPPVEPPPAVELRHTYAASDLWPRTSIERIKEAIPILELFPGARPSDGTGRWYVDRCPWHDDRSPSLRIDTRAGVAMCFAGCTDRALDVIAAYARLHNLDTKGAIKELVRRVA